MGLEGLVSKHRGRAYRGGRGGHRVRVKNRAHPTFACDGSGGFAVDPSGPIGPREHSRSPAHQIPPGVLCEINRSQEAKVLATCRPGRFCRVNGIVEDCKDLDECAEITRVLSARRR